MQCTHKCLHTLKTDASGEQAALCVFIYHVLMYVYVCLCAHRVEVSDAVENVDMSLEELQQLLLRSHQQSTVEAGTSAVMDVSKSVPYIYTYRNNT